MLYVSEIFKSIQGEGRFQGIPALFIRLSGCTRKCSFCDTKYHTNYKLYKNYEIENIIKHSNIETIIFTGGEPLLQLDSMIFLIGYLISKDFNYLKFHLETNGDLITEKNHTNILKYFHYICISPKEVKVAKKIRELYKDYLYNYVDIKVVSDLDKVNIDLILYATMLMPLTTDNEELNKEIRKKVWDYCVDNNLFYSGRLHVEVWGNSYKGK